MNVIIKIFSFIISFVCVVFISHGQTLITDSCGLDSSPILNKYEIMFVDSILFKPLTIKKSGSLDPKKGFVFIGKKIAFYSCTINSNTKGKGIISKQQFFNLVKPTPKGHAGIGLIKFTEIEKVNSNGFDAVIIIDCPYDNIDRKKLVSKLLVNDK